jgi:hypothetical protein
MNAIQDIVILRLHNSRSARDRLPDSGLRMRCREKRRFLDVFQYAIYTPLSTIGTRVYQTLQGLPRFKDKRDDIIRTGRSDTDYITSPSF